MLLAPSFLRTRLTSSLLLRSPSKSPSLRTLTSQMASHKLCMIPGPIELHPAVAAAASQPAMSHIDPQFVNTFGETLEMLRDIHLTKTAQPFLLSGSGTLGWDSVAANLLQPQDPVLVLNTGLFGDRFGECLETYGATVTHLRSPIGGRPSLEEVREALTQAKNNGTAYKLVTITHVDTSTGVLSDVKGLTQVIKSISPSTLVAVDGVCSVAAEEIRMDEWDVDVVLTASQKALGAPPGLSIVLVREAAMVGLVCG